MAASDQRIMLARFWRKLLRLTRGRVSVLRALEVIIQEQPPGPFKESVEEVHAAIEGGASLSDALRYHPDTFSLSVRELVRTAEQSGAWDDILQEIADGLADGTFD